MNYGLVKGWTNSTRFLLDGFNFEDKTWVYVGAFSQVEIDQRIEEGSWTFEDLMGGFDFSSQSEDFEPVGSSWDIQEEAEVVSRFVVCMVSSSGVVGRMLLGLGRMVS